MEHELKFKTTINCGGCVAKVTPVLNGISGIEWSVDTANPDKVLTVKGDGIKPDDIADAIRKAGFKAEEIV